ncbi:uncharacterized protein EDB93DRAFT_1327741 [Suillus bovinus]|uniref:uncharacterized protein n=1 Tax=Suillus bovinus TaxID=48563 RepID=UPI001B863798|nr:uncharacterized protein EDB93DRAFT_1327741 [Suillus bovinus]KAG2151178.1 hypothetical protein EDB93DRAFT_1327741 [Suillus bovinus]
MAHFGMHIEEFTKEKFDHKKRRLCCLAHIVNLTTQALLTAHSKSEHFDPTKPDTVLFASHGIQRDEVGLVHAICVKERSSAQCKELFKIIQLRNEDSHVPSKEHKQLLMDMKSSLRMYVYVLIYVFHYPTCICIAAEVDGMDGKLDEERESWDVMVEDGDSDDNGLASDIDDSEDAESTTPKDPYPLLVPRRLTISHTALTEKQKYDSPRTQRIPDSRSGGQAQYRGHWALADMVSLAAINAVKARTTSSKK